MAAIDIGTAVVAGNAIVASDMNARFTGLATWANGAPNIGVSGSTATMDGALTVTEALTASSTSQFNGTVTVGVDGTGHDVKFFGDTATNGYMLWDESTDDLILGTASKLGLGATSPSYPLHISTTDNRPIGIVSSAAGSYLDMRDTATTGEGYVSVGAVGNELRFIAGGSNRMTIDSSGQVGIGTTAPTALLQIQTSATTETELLHITGAWSVADRMGYICGTTSTDGAILARLGLGTSINGSNNNDGGFVFQTSTAANSSGGGLTDRMVIDHVGNVGIGTTSPDNLLHVYEGNSQTSSHADAQVTIENDLTVGLQLLSGSGQENRIIFGDRYDNDIGGITYDHDDNSMRFTTNTAERMRIMSDGRVGIGLTPSTNQMFQVQSTGEIPCVRLINTDASVGSANGMMYQQFTADADCTGAFFNLFADSAGYIGSITCASTSSIAFNTTSDYRIKSNVADLTDAVASVEDLRPITFTFTRDTEQRTHQGFLAHEVAEVYPGAVTGDKDAMRTVPAVDAVEAVEAVEYVPATYDEDGNELTPEVQAVEAVEAVEAVPEHEVEAHQMMDASKLVPLLTAAVQELTARIAALEAAA